MVKSAQIAEISKFQWESWPWGFQNTPYTCFETFRNQKTQIWTLLWRLNCNLTTPTCFSYNFEPRKHIISWLAIKKLHIFVKMSKNWPKITFFDNKYAFSEETEVMGILREPKNIKCHPYFINLPFWGNLKTRIQKKNKLFHRQECYIGRLWSARTPRHLTRGVRCRDALDT